MELGLDRNDMAVWSSLWHRSLVLIPPGASTRTSEPRRGRTATARWIDSKHRGCRPHHTCLDRALTADGCLSNGRIALLISHPVPAASCTLLPQT